MRRTHAALARRRCRDRDTDRLVLLAADRNNINIRGQAAPLHIARTFLILPILTIDRTSLLQPGDPRPDRLARWQRGRDFLTALACAFQVHTRLSDVAPVRARGFDHTVQGAYAVAAGVSRALGLTVEQAANAMAIAGTANNALRVTRTGALSNWKGLAYPQVAKEGTHAALLARVGITGPAEVFEGNERFKETIPGDFSIDGSAEDLERVLRTIVKKHNAEIYFHSILDAAIEIASTPGFDPSAIRAVRVTTFQVAFDVIGGGEEGDKRQVRTKEEADHSLPYMVAAALLDRQVQPAQYEPARIVAADIQHLLALVEIRPPGHTEQHLCLGQHRLPVLLLLGGPAELVDTAVVAGEGRGGAATPARSRHRGGHRPQRCARRTRPQAGSRSPPRYGYRTSVSPFLDQGVAGRRATHGNVPVDVCAASAASAPVAGRNVRR